jgi:hypothetical protein
LIPVNPKSAVSNVAGKLFRLPPGPTSERRLSRAIGFDCVGDENAGAQQAKQSCCFEHGVYSRTEGAEIQAEMGSYKRQSDAKQAPQKDHTEAGRPDGDLADAALNECRHGFAPLRSAAAAHFFQTCPAIFPIDQV